MAQVYSAPCVRLACTPDEGRRPTLLVLVRHGSDAHCLRAGAPWSAPASPPRSAPPSSGCSGWSPRPSSGCSGWSPRPSSGCSGWSPRACARPGGATIAAAP
eukprot:scaffold24826_cov135-Isochrysis_galbana.AAC.1